MDILDNSGSSKLNLERAVIQKAIDEHVGELTILRERIEQLEGSLISCLKRERDIAELKL